MSWNVTLMQTMTSKTNKTSKMTVTVLFTATCMPPQTDGEHCSIQVTEIDLRLPLPTCTVNCHARRLLQSNSTHWVETVLKGVRPHVLHASAVPVRQHDARLHRGLAKVQHHIVRAGARVFGELAVAGPIEDGEGAGVVE
jgi:hypothetical protein